MNDLHVLPTFFGSWRAVNWNDWAISLYFSIYMPWHYMVGEYIGSKLNWWEK